MPGKFASKRDELLHQLTMEGWSERSTGDVEAPCGFVSYLHLTASELGEPYLEKLNNIDAIDREDFLGDWIVIDDSQGFVTITKFDSALKAIMAVEEAEKVYAVWSAE